MHTHTRWPTRLAINIPTVPGVSLTSSTALCLGQFHQCNRRCLALLRKPLLTVYTVDFVPTVYFIVYFVQNKGWTHQAKIQLLRAY